MASDSTRGRRRVLVLSTVELAEALVGELVGDEEAETVVVVPAVRQSRLQWLTNEDDRARETAAHAAEQIAASSPGETVAARAGDPDPMVALQDALREHGADEIVVVTRSGEQAGWLEERALEAPEGELAGIPIRNVVLAPDGSVSGS